MTTETIERRKLLVIDDGVADMDCYKQRHEDLVDLPIVHDYSNGWSYPRVDVEKSLENIENCLRETPYVAIFMDGKLGLGLDARIRDGQILVEKIRRGDYGPLNQSVEIQDHSSDHALEDVGHDISKSSLQMGSQYRNPITYAKKILGIE